ncbi:MAG TPA: hypothetical protein VFG72_15665 [Marmoricola sp.]|nr:hypothetical protein [Marmoricola sp.]
MTTTANLSTDARVEAAPSWSGAMRLAGGVALVAGPLLFSAGMFTSPPADSMADVDYISSLARDLTMTQVSALFLHYANVLIGLGILAAPSLVRGARGLRLVVAGSLATALGFVNVSGMILADWWNAATGTLLDIDEAAAVFAHVKSASMLGLWNGTELFSMLGPVLLLAGLARAGVLGWWTIALLLGGVAGLIALGSSLPILAAVATLVGFSPFALVGMRLVQRHRLETR